MDDTRKARSYYVLTALGTDRPGIVAEATEFLERHGCNVEESRMAILGGEFGLLMLVSVDQERAGTISNDIPKFAESSGLDVRWKMTKPPEVHRHPDALPYSLTAYGLDHEGIVHAISQALYDMGVNIVSAATSTYPAPVSGAPLFQMEMEIDVPQGLKIPALRDALEKVAQEQNTDIELAFEKALP